MTAARTTRIALALFAPAAWALVVPSVALAAPPTVTLMLPTATPIHGAPVAASGVVEPVVAGASVALELDAGAGWETVATSTTDETGAFAVSFTARAGAVRARLPELGTVGAEQALVVQPRIVVRRRTGKAFLGASLTAAVRPRTYAGMVSIAVTKWARVVARKTAFVTGGRLRTTVPTPGVGRFRIRLAFPASGSVVARTVATKVESGAPTLRLGTTGTFVRALQRRLAALRFRTAGSTGTFGQATYDAVIAFQKYYGLSRTGVVDWSTWSLLGRSRGARPRYASPTPHIEVDKSRQILMVVRYGRVVGVLPVSTGASGNTPVGRFRILWKAPATSTWLGSAILYRTLTFHGNFAIHGYPSVPPWPASHGCVRVPMWAANWLYVRSPVGERVFVYA